MSYNWSLFETNIIQEQNNNCCDNPDIIITENYHTCTNCGLADISTQKYNIYFNDDNNIKRKIPYKRLIYFKQKLKLINCQIHYQLNAKLLYFITINRNKKIKSIYYLKKIMKKSKLHKYYKYIYSIYFAITGKKIININYEQISNIINMFIQFERIFEKHKIRKNLYSYNLLIYFMLAYFNNIGYVYMILPLNKRKIKKQCIKLFKLMDIKIE